MDRRGEVQTLLDGITSTQTSDPVEIPDGYNAVQIQIVDDGSLDSSAQAYGSLNGTDWSDIESAVEEAGFITIEHPPKWVKVTLTRTAGTATVLLQYIKDNS